MDDDEARALAEATRFFGALHDALAAGPLTDLRRPVRARFALGAAAGSWLLTASPDQPGSCQREDPGSARDAVDCVVSASLRVLLDLAARRIKPAAALIKGQVRVTGERAIFFSLRGALATAIATHTRERGGWPGSTGAPLATRLCANVVGVSITASAHDPERYAVYHVSGVVAQSPIALVVVGGVAEASPRVATWQ